MSDPDLPRESQSEATVRSYDALARAYAEHLFHELERKPFDRAVLERFEAGSPPRPCADLGCGPGHVGRFLAGLGREVTGVDLSAGMLEIARQLCPGLSFQLGDLRALPFKANSLAGVAAFYAIVHLDAAGLGQALSEMGRVLVPGGSAVLAFHVGQQVVRVEELWGVKTSLEFSFFEPEAVLAALSSESFEIVECQTRRPYDADVEAQTERCYIVARSRGKREGARGI
jgi:SAM-dependent methyltransferase